MSLGIEDLDPDGFTSFFADGMEHDVRDNVLPDGRWALKRELRTAYRGGCGARMERLDGDRIRLQPYTSSMIEVDGELVDCGIATNGLRLHRSDELISAEGSSTGAAPSASTTYYAYVCNSKSGMGASNNVAGDGVEYMSGPRLRLSATAPTLLCRAPTAGHAVFAIGPTLGVKYLGATDGARCWRFVGWVRLDVSGNFADSDTQRFVANYHNRLRKRLYSNPAYSNGNTITTWTTTSTSYTPWNGGTGSKLEFVANGEDAVTYWAIITASVGTSQKHIGMGEDSTTQPAVAAGEDPAGGARSSFGVKNSYAPAEGYRHLNALIVSSGGNTLTVDADGPRYGAAADPPESYIGAEVMV